MHDVVAGERENLLNSGVVAGGESFREGVVGSGFGLSGKPAGPQHMGSASLRRMAAGTMVNELDDTDEFVGVRDAYDAAEGGACHQAEAGQKESQGERDRAVSGRWRSQSDRIGRQGALRRIRRRLRRGRAGSADEG